MRTLFLLVLLADVALLAWMHWLAPSPDYAQALPADLPRLQRIEEVALSQLGRPTGEPSPAADGGGWGREEEGGQGTGDGGRSTSEAPSEGEASVGAASVGAASAANESDSEPALRCRSLGPFTSVGEANRASSILGGLGYSPMQRVAEGEVWFGYWVYLSPFPSTEAAEEMARELDRNLVEDYYVVRGGEMADAISLGVFSERSRAETRATDMREMGFPAEITDRYRTAPVYWLDVMEDPADPVPLNRLQDAAPGRVIRAESGSCEVPG